jgi:tRNA1(Val) A37 N6-methylase TrmN6
VQKKFTYAYSQPEEYHFSLDSIDMPRLVAERYKNQELEDFTVLDLCSGCGVLGFEFHFYLPQIQNLHFLEIQKEQYRFHFERNLSMVREKKSKTNFDIFWDNYENRMSSQFENRYDVIICNPPYFQKGQGKLSPSEFKNRCRFFMDSSLESLISFMIFALKKKGEAYFLIRSLSDHNKNLLSQVAEFTKDKGILEEVGIIRGTNLLKIQK